MRHATAVLHHLLLIHILNAGLLNLMDHFIILILLLIIQSLLHTMYAFSIQEWVSVYASTSHICTHTLHTYTTHKYIQKHSNLRPSSHKKSLAALYLKDTTDWKCVRMCETQSPEHSLFSTSVTESGYTHSHTHTYIPNLHTQPSCTHQPLKLHSHFLVNQIAWWKIMKVCFKKFSFLLNCSLPRTVSLLLTQTVLLWWIKVPAAIYYLRWDGKWEDQDLLYVVTHQTWVYVLIQALMVQLCVWGRMFACVYMCPCVMDELMWQGRCNAEP